MPRKKKSESPEVMADGATAPEATNELSFPADLSIPGTAEEIISGDFVEGAPSSRTAEVTDALEPAAETRQFRPVRHTFTSDTAGVRAGEDKRFKAPQAFVDFDDDKRATDAEKADLRESGFRYRPSDKGYSALANPETREARDQLAQKFTDRRLKEKTDRGEGQDR